MSRRGVTRGGWAYGDRARPPSVCSLDAKVCVIEKEWKGGHASKARMSRRGFTRGGWAYGGRVWLPSVGKKGGKGGKGERKAKETYWYKYINSQVAV